MSDHDQHLEDEANRITAELRALHERLHSNAELARLVPFFIQQRGQRERNRLEKIYSCQGTDSETLWILQTQSQHWHKKPWLFGHLPTMVQTHTLDPLVNLASRFLQLRHEDS